SRILAFAFFLYSPSAYSFSLSVFYCSCLLRHLHSFPTRRSSDLPGISLLVLSDSKHRTPSRPISAIFVKFAGSPTGVKSNLKSRSEEHTSELQSRFDLVCRLLLEKKNINYIYFFII